MADDPDDGDRRYDEIKNGDRPAPPQLRTRFGFREYPIFDADGVEIIGVDFGKNGPAFWPRDPRTSK